MEVYEVRTVRRLADDEKEDKEQELQCRLLIRQSPGSGTTGGIVWNAAKVLLHVLGTEPGVQVGGRRVIDLGSGTGVLGLACAALGASRVVLTDVPQQLALLEDNAARNLPQMPVGSAQPEVEGLAWGSQVSHVSPPFDVVLCSDVIFCAHNAGCLPALLDTILRLSEESTEVVVAFQERLGWIETKFVDQIKCRFGACREIDIGESLLRRATEREGEEEFEGMSSMFHEDIGMHVYVFSGKLPHSSPARDPPTP